MKQRVLTVLALAVVAVHLAVLVAHDAAHGELGVTLLPWQTLYAYALIVTAPLVAAGLLVAGRMRARFGLLWFSMAAALVFGGRPNLPGSLSEDIRMMRSSRHMMVLTSSEPGYVREIYGAGAWLVLPALRNGCLDLTSYPDR